VAIATRLATIYNYKDKLSGFARKREEGRQLSSYNPIKFHRSRVPVRNTSALDLWNSMGLQLLDYLAVLRDSGFQPEPSSFIDLSIGFRLRHYGGSGLLALW